MTKNHAPSAARDMLRVGLTLASQSKYLEALKIAWAATEADPNYGAAWRFLGDLLRRSGSLAAASACFEKAIDSGDDHPLNKFLLSAVGVGEIVHSPPSNFVTSLFDEYAPRFDEHLLSVLKYQAPALLARLIGAGIYESTIDLGCGTGLAGQAFRAQSRRLTGVDLSDHMLEFAKKRGIYDRLVHQDIGYFLNNASESFDLVLCCDVFIYVGNLAPFFSALRRLIRPHGSFAFTVERSNVPEGFDLLPQLRYAHSESYIERLANENRLTVVAAERATIREHEGLPVEGLLFHLRAEA